MSFLDPLTWLNALVNCLEELKQSNGVTPVFEEVSLYDSTDLDLAMNDLTKRKNRLCFVIPQEDSFENRLEGRVVVSDSNYRVTLLIADKDYRSGQRAHFGDEDSPGVIGMKNYVLQAITGNNLGINFVTMQPIEGDTLHLAHRKTKATLRKAYQLTFQTPAGRIQTEVQRGTLIRT